MCYFCVSVTFERANYLRIRVDRNGAVRQGSLIEHVGLSTYVSLANPPVEEPPPFKE